MEAQKTKKVESNVRGIKNAFLVIVACFIIAECIYWFIYGAPENFDAASGRPLNLLGTVFEGGFVVPIIQCLFLTVIVLAVERWIALGSAEGKGSIAKFVKEVKAALAKNDIAKAQELCAKQKGSIGAIVHAVLIKYTEMDQNTVLSKEQKLAIIQKEVEEATALEMPSLQQNLPIIATMTTLGTLLGMIKSFQAMGQSGAPDSTALSVGISEALVNTASGIATGAFAVIFYNFFTNKIDNMTYAIDEVGFSIVSTFAATH